MAGTVAHFPSNNWFDRHSILAVLAAQCSTDSSRKKPSCCPPVQTSLLYDLRYTTKILNHVTPSVELVMQMWAMW